MASDATDELFYAWVDWLHSDGQSGSVCPMFRGYSGGQRGGGYSPGACVESLIDEAVNRVAIDYPKHIEVLKMHFNYYPEHKNQRIKDKARQLQIGLATYYKYLDVARDQVIEHVYSK